MEEKYNYYTYAILFLSIVLHSTLFINFSKITVIIQSFIFFGIFLVSTYLMYSLEKGEEVERYLLILFSFSVINGLILFLLLKNLNSILLSILNLAGLYTVIFSIPDKKINFSNVNIVEEQTLSPSYNNGKSDEINQNFQKNRIQNKQEFTQSLDLLEDDDESDIVIEEIKPIQDTTEKKSKRNKPKSKK